MLEYLAINYSKDNSLLTNLTLTTYIINKGYQSLAY